MHTQDLSPWTHHHVFDQGNAHHHEHGRAQGHAHQHDQHRRHHDFNLRSAYVHVVAVWAIGLLQSTSRVLLDCALTVVTADPTVSPGHVRQHLTPHDEIVHATIEVQRCS